jgi:hypothetical protein
MDLIFYVEYAPPVIYYRSSHVQNSFHIKLSSLNVLSPPNLDRHFSQNQIHRL